MINLCVRSRGRGKSTGKRGKMFPLSVRERDKIKWLLAAVVLAMLDKLAQHNGWPEIISVAILLSLVVCGTSAICWDKEESQRYHAEVHTPTRVFLSLSRDEPRYRIVHRPLARKPPTSAELAERLRLVCEHHARRTLTRRRLATR